MSGQCPNQDCGYTAELIQNQFSCPNCGILPKGEDMDIKATDLYAIVDHSEKGIGTRFALQKLLSLAYQKDPKLVKQFAEKIGYQ